MAKSRDSFIKALADEEDNLERYLNKNVKD
jgi:hypothetical protein